MGEIAINKAIDAGDFHSRLLENTPTLAGKIITTRKLTDTTGEIVHNDTLTGGETSSIDTFITNYTPLLQLVKGEKHRTGNTTNATPATVAPLQLPENCVAAVTVNAVAASGTNVARWEIRATAKRATGNAIMVDTPIITKWDDTALASATCTIIVTGQNVAVQVTGINATNILWTGKISFEAVVS